MVDMPASDSQPTAIDISIVTHLTFYKAGAMGKGKKQMKEIKAKTFNHSFSELKESYLELLTAILQKHHVNKKYKVTACNVYPCKIQIHPAKYVYLIYFMISRQGDVPDAVIYEEYKDLVKNTILSAPGGNPVVGKHFICERLFDA